MHRNRMLCRYLIPSVIIFPCLILGFDAPAVSASTAELSLDGYDQNCGIEVSQQDELIRVSWPVQDRGIGVVTFDLSDGLPLIHSMAISSAENSSPRVIAEALDPIYLLRVGKRDLAKRDGWTIFFDRMQEKPHELYKAVIERNYARATSRGNRATVVFGDVTAGPFTGELQWTFFSGSPFVLQEMVLSTSNNAVAYLYDTGLICRNSSPKQMVWQNTEGNIQTRRVSEIQRSENIPVHGRAVCAEYDDGCIALFPPPHRYFYPLDFSDNQKNIWVGPGYAEQQIPFGLGIRHNPRGDNRFVPWFNAPPDTQQSLGVFLQLCEQSPEFCLAEVAALTRDDEFKPLPGYKVFSSHFHVEHTQEVLGAQKSLSRVDREGADRINTPSGDTYQIPQTLESPGFVRVLRGMGINAVHLAEFHFGHTPRMNTAERMRHLDVLHAECRRLSSEDFLLLPGEEPNVHFGGHWISFFPQPVHWVLNRPKGTSLVSEHPKYGKVYHVGSKADVLQLLKAERGLAWTAHPRIKGSTGFPDNYRQQLFFASDRFLGGGPGKQCRPICRSHGLALEFSICWMTWPTGVIPNMPWAKSTSSRSNPTTSCMAT